MVGDSLPICVRCDEFAPAAVREEVAKQFDLGCRLADALLVASELVTNAVRHSHCSRDEYLSVFISVNGRVRISVLDPGKSGREAEITDRPIERGGIGLKVVDQLATNWGAERHGHGYRVWAELDLSPVG
jgi:anti-sigma regulatory factor (Ser/Thr protein kinase)